MARLYELTDAARAVLTAKVTGLPVARQDAEQETAESLLRLRAPAYELEADVDKLTLAIAHQMNFQVAQGVDPRFMSAAASSHSKQSDVYRDRVIDPIAAMLVEEVTLQYATASSFGDVFTSFRTRGGTG